MIISILYLILNSVLPDQWNPFDPTATTKPPEEWFDGASLVLWILAWVFFGIGITAIAVLVLYTKYGREISVRLSVIAILIASIFLGFSIHFLLLNFGY